MTPSPPNPTGTRARPTRGTPRREISPPGVEALAHACASHQALTDARAQAADASRQRRTAVLLANRGGASYRVIAAALGVSLPSVQHLVDAARVAEDQP